MKSKDLIAEAKKKNAAALAAAFKTGDEACLHAALPRQRRALSVE